MTHNVPVQHVLKHTKSISDTKRREVANLQNYIQELLVDHQTFLQGSYANDTSISDINDVDIVAIRKDTFSSVHSGIVCPTSIAWECIFAEIEEKLENQNRYDWTIKRSDSGKCIEVSTSTFKADVVPAVKITHDIMTDPIAIYSFKTGLEKVNSPRTHIKNGAEKHNKTNENFKPVVRMFKNWSKNHFGDADVVSSYQIESLVHASPNENFANDHVSSFILVGSHILESLAQETQVPSVCGTEHITNNWDSQLFRNTLASSLVQSLAAYRATTAQEAVTAWDKAFNI
ncbi:MAG: hypothetical protein WC536_00655 [Patescibacteria group bacterium]